MKFRKFILSSLVLCLALKLGAQTTPAESVADALESETTQKSEGLVNSRERWKSLTDEQKQAWRERYKKIPPEKRDRLKKNMSNWKNLSKEEKKEIRKRWKKFKSMSPEKRKKMKEKFQKWNSLPEEKKNKIKNKMRKRKHSKEQ